MTQDLLGSALHRLEAALARLEAIEPPASAPAAPAPAPADTALRDRHDRLRARVRDAVERLDGMLAGDSPAGGGAD